ncbi:MAG TPA: CBS domain-containing protein [Longimicrobiaceae bacterium]|nr:CBS domain-containing protein [Longimicrobiaceae bacterium]
MSQVRELLRTKSADLVTVEPNTDVGNAVRLLQRHNIGGLPVVEPDGQLVGFLGERDVIRALDRNIDTVRGLPVSSVMEAPPTCSPDDSLQEVMGRMTRERHRHLLVLEGGRLSGILSIGDLVKHRLDQLEMETGVLRDYVVASRART